MRCIHRSIVGLFLLFAGAGTLSAQTVSTTPDSTKVATLTTVTVTPSGNWFTRSDDLRKSVTAAMAENRRLAAVIHMQDVQMARLSARLDSLKRIEFIQTVKIATLDDSIAATRARRRALEARILAAESKLPQP